MRGVPLVCPGIVHRPGEDKLSVVCRMRQRYWLVSSAVLCQVVEAGLLASLGKEQFPLSIHGYRVSREVERVTVPASEGGPLSFFERAKYLVNADDLGILPRDQLAAGDG